MRYVLLTLPLLALGCHQTHLSVSDTFRVAGEPATLEARIEQHASGSSLKPVANMPVRFFSHDTFLGEARTDAMGVARLMHALEADASHYRAEAENSGTKLTREGLIFTFPKGRTVIVCDIDGTVSKTHYRELVLDPGDDMASIPFPDAADTLRMLSERYGLVYLTARPGSLLEKTKRWLKVNGFPPSPVITTPSLAQSIAVQKFKSERIAHLESVLGTVGIGIGNAATDSEAYAMRDLLPLIIDDDDDAKFRSHTVILRNWRMVREFFEANAAVLEDPARLADAIRGEQMIRRPLIRFQKEK